MIRLMALCFMLLYANMAQAALMRGPDGRWYGNICVTQMGVQPVPWQPVGSICYAPGYNLYGFIANS